VNSIGARRAAGINCRIACDRPGIIFPIGRRSFRLNHLRLWQTSCRLWHAACDGFRVARSTSKGHLKMVRVLKAFFADETGATAIEYGLIAAGISLAIIAAVNGLGSKLNTKFSAINSSLK
jgi:pilus assembly protein Flp/PilA